MTVIWNRHRFSGGLLILDTTNTVVLRGDAARSFDRFADTAEIGRFAEAAGDLRADELRGRRLVFGEAFDRWHMALPSPPPPPPSAVPLPRKTGEDPGGGASGSSPAKRGRGTTRSVVEGAETAGMGEAAFAEAVGRVIELREAADRLFRAAVERQVLGTAALAQMMAAGASCLDGENEEVGASDTPFGVGPKPLRFEAALAVSALSLVAGEQWRRVKICPNCNWLFVDRSRNASRLWCDMTVCGNRQKAKRHYGRSKARETSDA